MEFPIFKTKIKGLSKKFDLRDSKQAKDYFELKTGKEIEKLRKYFKENTLIAYFLGKKNSGKGTYSKIFSEVVAFDKITHFSVGDMIREIDKELKNPKRKKEFKLFLKKNYRGFIPLNEIFSILEKRNTKELLPTPLILVLIKREILKREKKTIFIDGFPRDLDQISFSLFFKDLIGYRDDPDIFILIDVPNLVIEERIKWRRICPLCQNSKNLKFHISSNIKYDKEKKEFYFLCDNPKCKKAKMIKKEGDELGIEPIKERLLQDEELIKKAISLEGIPKIFLRNCIPVNIATNYVDDYEITPEYILEWDEKEKITKIKEKPWIVKDDKGNLSFSLLPQPVVVSLIYKMAEILGL